MQAEICSGVRPCRHQPLWDAVQAQLARNAAERNSSARHRQPSLLAGLLYDGDGNRMTPSHAVKNGTRYRYYVSGSLITKDRDRRADHRGTLVGSPVLWRQQASACILGPRPHEKASNHNPV
jgi:hypothetical protein